MSAPASHRFYIVPMQRVENAAKIAYCQQYRQRKREKLKQQKTNVLDDAWKRKLAKNRATGKIPIWTLWDAAQRFCSTIIYKTKSRQRFRQARNEYLRALDYLGRETPVHKVDKEMLLQYREVLLGKGMKFSSINRYMRAIYMLLRYCRDTWGIIDHFPILTPLKVAERKFVFLTTKDEKRLLAAAPKALWRFVTFILGTGARKSEAIWLKWENVFLKSKGRSWVRFVNTKNGHPNSVPLPTHVAEMLKRMKREQTPRTDYVFTYRPQKDISREDGTIAIRSGVSTHYRWPDLHFKQARLRSGVLNITIHGLRHTYASRLIMRGGSVFDVARLRSGAG